MAAPPLSLYGDPDPIGDPDNTALAPEAGMGKSKLHDTVTEYHSVFLAGMTVNRVHGDRKGLST